MDQPSGWTSEYRVNACDLTPEIEFNGASGFLRIQGKSLPENPMEVYSPMMDWLEHYVQNPAEKTVLSVALLYYNTSTSKILFSVVRILERLWRLGRSVEVEWCYSPGDTDMEEAGRDFAAVTPIHFTYVEEMRK